MARCSRCKAWRPGFLLDSKRLCGRCTATATHSTTSPDLDPEAGRRRQLESYSKLNVASRVQWTATMSLHTPLRSLERHGEIFEGDPRDAPMYGDAAEGTWVPVVDWKRLGLEPPDPGEMWSVVGQIPTDGGDFLPFLLRFRRIVESGETVAEKLDRIESLCDSRSEFRQIALKIAESGDAGQRVGGTDFATKFFAQRLEEIPGLGPGTALRLFVAGFHTLEDLETASDEGLLQVRGVGATLVKKIRAHLTDR